MTKRELEARTGLSRSALWYFSKDDHIGRAQLKTLARVAEAIGCSVKDLFEE